MMELATWFDATLYAGKWQETGKEEVPAELVKQIESAHVEMGTGVHNDEYDFDGRLQIVLKLKDGRVGYLKLSTLSDLQEGDNVSPKSLRKITLSRAGDDDIYRFDGDAI